MDFTLWTASCCCSYIVFICKWKGKSLAEGGRTRSRTPCDHELDSSSDLHTSSSSVQLLSPTVHNGVATGGLLAPESSAICQATLQSLPPFYCVLPTVLQSIAARCADLGCCRALHRAVWRSNSAAGSHWSDSRAQDGWRWQRPLPSPRGFLCTYRTPTHICLEHRSLKLK